MHISAHTKHKLSIYARKENSYLTFLLSNGIAISPPLGIDAWPDVELEDIFPINALKDLDETANRLMAESDCIVATGDLIFRRSQIFALLSSDPEIIFSSWDVKTAEVTVSWWPWNTDTEWMASRKSHKRNVESFEDVTTKRWLGWAAVCVSSSSWPAS